MGWFEERFQQSDRRHRHDCVQCGRAMWLPLSRIGRSQTCSEQCNSDRRAAVKAARSRACETCGKEFVPRLAGIKLGRGRFCSRTCTPTPLDALHAPEAKEKARAAWLASYEKAPFLPTGEKNHRWNGGPEAAAIRARARIVEYRKENPERVRTWQANRRARGGARLSADVVLRLHGLQRGRCAICSVVLDEGYHLDHIKPLALGGDSSPDNFQLLCRSCNLHKAAKDPIDHMQSKGYLL